MDFKDQLKLLISITDNVSTLTTKTGQELDKKNVPEQLKVIGPVFLDLIIKINSNFEGLLILLKGYKDQPELKIPISLVCRCLMSDVLTGYYLSSLKDEKSFKAELNILGMDYISYVNFAINDTETTSNKAFKGATKISIRQRVKEHFPELIKEIKDNKLMPFSRSELRKSSQIDFIKKKENLNAKITDSFKYEFLKNDPYLSQIKIVYHLLRHFSQYQHYCFENRYALFIDPDQIFNYIIQAVCYSIHALYTFFKLVGAPEDYFVELDMYLIKFKHFKGAMIYTGD